MFPRKLSDTQGFQTPHLPREATRFKPAPRGRSFSVGYLTWADDLVLRNRPDIAEQWSADEIALRWCRVFPPRDDATGEPVEPGEHDLAMLTANSDRLAEVRKRLANLSWFMRCLPCCWIGRGGNSARTSAARFRITWPRSWSGWGSIESKLGGNRARTGRAISSRRRADRAHSSYDTRGTPLAALVSGQGGRSNRLCVGHWLDTEPSKQTSPRRLHSTKCGPAHLRSPLVARCRADRNQDEPFYVSRQVTAPIRWSS